MDMRAFLSTLAAGVLVAGCASLGGAPGPKAVANLASTKGNSASGTVTFEQQGDKVRVSGTVTGLKANAEHGFHVHEKGDCSSGDGMSAGGHFNPLGKAHGHQGAEHHAGDMPNLRADAYGNASFSFEVAGITVGSGATDIVGRGLIVHRDPDDYKSQPAGNAGPRLACAVIAKG
ncbi:MAG: superoxide dismutase family protein [Betaproteobacteria bacterium]|nr:superoxide dismutase family protein [Betaproteobacteria bacterium]PWB67232.1 MAG: superoxide dismutase [Betaproteobacteria bacterium]